MKACKKCKTEKPLDEYQRAWVEYRRAESA